MKKYTLFIVLIFFINTSTFAQIKPHLSNYKADEIHTYRASDLTPLNYQKNNIPQVARPLSGNKHLYNQPLPAYRKGVERLKVIKDVNNDLPIFIKGTIEDKQDATIPTTKSAWIDKSYDYLITIGEVLKITDPTTEFVVKNVATDELGQTHIKLQQQYKGIEVYGAEVILHTDEAVVNRLNGRYFVTPDLENLTPNLAKATAINQVKTALSEKVKFKNLSAAELKLVVGAPESSQLVIFHQDKEARLAYQIDLIPNLAEHWTYIVDAHTGEILRQFSHICKFTGDLEHKHQKENKTKKTTNVSTVTNCTAHMPPPDGPRTAQASDLNGVTRNINTYESGPAFYMIDASRDMFAPQQSQFPGDPAGVVWTIDAFDTAPQNDNFRYENIASTSNQWSRPIAVSAHVNGGKAFEYFKNQFGHSSINGQGGNIISLINIADEDGSDMDNAFWNGSAIFYGNGRTAFHSPLARSLDVAAHEMSHGVIQATANLEYFGESGALNESFADVFAVLIDRDDYQIGEDISNNQIFPTGFLRDMENPHNGGNSLADNGWQPDHVNEQYRGQEDNGGVHINSGITNRAFYVLSSQIGREKAEQIYYRALVRYLTRSSQFVDARLAIIQAAEDRHGAGSTEATAAANAFSSVGIGSGAPTNEQENLEENPGSEFILLSDVGFTGLYVSNPEGEIVRNPLISTSVLSKPSITDNGREAVYIARDNTMRLYDFAEDQEFTISSEPIWRNVVISKDGLRLAAITTDLEPRIMVYDFVSQRWGDYTLTNPTYAQGVATGDVQFADAMEWDYDGEFLMYDAISRIEGNFGNEIEYWDIGFIRVWNESTNNFGDGFISKLFSGLPEDVSIGNPTFAKLSPFIVAYDYIDEFANEYELQAVNIETNDLGTLFRNGQLSYPSYSSDDTQIIFDAATDVEEVIAIMDLKEDKINSDGDAFILVSGGKWGVWFATGERSLETNVETLDGGVWLDVYPNPVTNNLMIEWTNSAFQPERVEVLDVLGQQVLLESVTGGNTFNLDLKKLTKGSYFLRLTADNQQVVQKIVKQ